MREIRTFKYALQHYWMNKHTGEINTYHEARWKLIEFFDFSWDVLCEHYTLTNIEVNRG